jgi:hypothetical protein
MRCTRREQAVANPCSPNVAQASLLLPLTFQVELLSPRASNVRGRRTKRISKVCTYYSPTLSRSLLSPLCCVSAPAGVALNDDAREKAKRRQSLAASSARRKSLLLGTPAKSLFAPFRPPFFSLSQLSFVVCRKRNPLGALEGDEKGNAGLVPSYSSLSQSVLCDPLPSQTGKNKLNEPAKKVLTNQGLSDLYTQWCVLLLLLSPPQLWLLLHANMLSCLHALFFSVAPLPSQHQTGDQQ